MAPGNCRIKEECPGDGMCRKTNVIYKCVGSTINDPNKVYDETAKGDFKKKRYCNHKASLKSRHGEKNSALSKNILRM